MVEVPDRLMAERVIIEAREYGDFDMPGNIALGRHGQGEAELDWSLRDLNPGDCEVDMEDTAVVVTGEIEGEYSIRVSRRTHHHPAEYRHEYVPIHVVIEMDLDGLDEPTVTGIIA